MKKEKTVKRWGNTAVGENVKNGKPLGSAYKLPRPHVTFFTHINKCMYTHVCASLTCTHTCTLLYAQDSNIQWVDTLSLSLLS